MMIAIPAGSYVNLAVSGSIDARHGNLTGFYVNNTNLGVIQLLDGGSGGTAIDGQITPAIGWHFYPVTFTVSGGPYLSIVSGAINITFIYNPTPLS